MHVIKFSEILLWPLRLVIPDDKNFNNLAEELSDFKPDGKKIWEEIKDLKTLKTDCETVSDEDKKNAYAAQVYFHPFIQEFLFSKEKDLKKRPVRVFSRCGLKDTKMTVKFQRDKYCCDTFTGVIENHHTIDLTIKSVHLYIFDGNVAILATHIATEKDTKVTRTCKHDNKEFKDDINIYDVQALQDQIRRVYPPYWQGENAENVTTGGMAFEIKIDGLTHDNNIHKNFETHITWTDHYNSAPIASPWYELIAPLIHEHDEHNKNKDQFSVAHLLDDRQIIMSHIAVPDPHLLTKGDKIRLCFADSAGDSDSLPYGKKFLENFEEDHCYERFWEKGTWKDTLYMVSDYSLINVGSDNWFFKNVVSGHFKDIYFRLYLLAVLQRAVLLQLKYRATQIVQKFNDTQDGKKFIKDVQKLHQNLLDFNTRYWFNDASNQEQAKELYHIIRDKMKTCSMFNEFKEEIQSLNEHVEKLNNVVFQMEQNAQTEASNRFARIGAVFTLISIIYLVFSQSQEVFLPTGTATENGYVPLKDKFCQLGTGSLILAIVFYWDCIKNYWDCIKKTICKLSKFFG